MAKKQILSKNFSFRDDVYGVIYEVLIGGNVNDLVKIAKDKYNVPIIEHSKNIPGWFAFSEEISAAFIWLSKLEHEIQDIGFLVHESQHATFDILYSRGLIYDDKSAEAFTYYQQYLITQIIGNFISE